MKWGVFIREADGSVFLERICDSEREADDQAELTPRRKGEIVWAMPMERAALRILDGEAA